MARPTIISDTIIDAFKEVLSEDLNAIILTDKELVILVNDRLPSPERFSWSAYKDWKAFASGEKSDTTLENMRRYEELGSLIVRSLITQKRHLFKKLQSESQWHKFAWIIERKFSEWNLKHVSEVKDNTKDKFERAIARAEEIALKYGGATND
ncbi:MAG: hypothetical protein HOB70_00675 [Chloroflexi bacterium]|jgi:hypothetical protein|nr:hypothetical protein [Chloroflexota bacterium]